MAECTVCGKKGLFLFVNNSGRCRDCEYAYREEQDKLRRIEEEKLALIEKEKREKEELQIADARAKLYEILDRIFLLRTEYVVMPWNCEDLLPIIDEHIEQSYDLWLRMVRRADENPFFFAELKRYAYSKNESEKYSGNVQQGIYNAFQYGSDPHSESIKYLERYGWDFEKKWKKEKKKVEHIAKKYQKEKCEAGNKCDNSKDVLNGEKSETIEKSISADENVLIEKYRLLNDEGRSKAYEHMEMLTKVPEHRSEN